MILYSRYRTLTVDVYMKSSEKKIRNTYQINQRISKCSQRVQKYNKLHYMETKTTHRTQKDQK